MERLIHRSPPLPSRLLYTKPHPLPSHLGPVNLPKLGFSFPSVAAESTRVAVASFSSRNGGLLPSSCLSNPNDPSSFRSSPPTSQFGDLSIGPASDSGFVDPLSSQVHSISSSKCRFLTLTQAIVVGGKMILLPALAMLLIHPSPALASFAAAVKTGGASASSIGRGLLRTEILSSAWTGFFAGCLHTLSGPDHLAALAPLSIGRTRIESAVVGALWGCGHDAGQVIFGLLFLLLKDRLHIEILQTWCTRVVALTLIVIGAMGIKEASSVPTPCVVLENGERDVSSYEALVAPAFERKKKIGLATFATGIVHGLQPDALMMILPALALPSRVAGVAFMCMFLVGTVVAMGGYTVFIGSCSQALKERVPKITEKLTWASSLVAIGLGLAILIGQIFGFSLY